jgi:hypothetical protein
LADLPVQDIDLPLAGRALGQAAALKNTRGAVQQLLLPIVDLVRMNPERTRQLGDRPVAPCLRRGKLLIAASATFALNAELCFFPVPFMSCSCATGAFYGQEDSTLTYCRIFGVQLNLAMPPLPHHRAYGSVPRRFGGLSTHQLFHGKQAQTPRAPRRPHAGRSGEWGEP